MKKLSIKDFVDFRRKSEQGKKTFVAKLKLDKVKGFKEGGGNYWTISISAISRAFRSNDLQIIEDKIDEVKDKFDTTGHNISKVMYQRNINILNNYVDYDFKRWYPSKKFTLIKTKKADSVITIKGLEIDVTPHCVFNFRKDDIEEIGAIWFVAKLNGFKKDELGMFVDILYKYLKTHFLKGYQINPKYCVAVDVVNCLEVNYSQIQKNEIPTLLFSTIDEIKKY